MEHNTFGRELLDRVMAGSGSGAESLTHVADIPSRRAEFTPWPAWIPARVRDGLVDEGVQEPWRHQAEAAEHARTFGWDRTAGRLLDVYRGAVRERARREHRRWEHR